MIAERGGERELLFRRRARVLESARRNARPVAAPACRSRRGGRRRSPRRSAPASTSRARRRRGSPRETPRAPCLRASPDRRRQNMKAPDTAHSPGSAARSNTKVSDGSSRMVRSSFMLRGPRVSGSSQIGLASAGNERPPLDFGLAHAPHQQIAVVVDVAAHALLRREPRQVVFGHRREAELLPGVDLHHQMPREAADQLRGADIVEALFLERRGQRPQSRLALGHRHGADHAAEHQPLRRLVFAGLAARRAARRRPAPDRHRSRRARRSAIGFSGGACAISASASAAMPA